MGDGSTLHHDDAPKVRTLPYHIEAEKAFLGAVFVERSRTIMETVTDFLRPEHFAYAPHGRIFEAAAKVTGRGQIADPVTLRRYFEADEGLAEIGGPAYLNDLAHSAVTVINAIEYARMIHDLWRRREVIVVLEAAAEDLYGAEAETDDVLERHETALAALADDGADRGGLAPMSELVVPALDEIERAQASEGTVGLTTGLGDLDRFTGGLMPSDLVVIAARPGMGKTALALTIALANARAGRRVALFSLEMSAEQLVMRMMAMETGIAASDMRTGGIADVEVGTLREVGRAVQDLPLMIDDRGGVPVSYVRRRARAMQRKYGLDLVVVDYLGLVRPEERYRGQRVNEISETTATFKTLAKELGVPVVVLSQLSRDVERRDDKRPRLSDLRDSGSIEQDADAVMFIYREAYYIDQEGEPTLRAGENDDAFADRHADWIKRRDRAAGRAEIIVAKQRMGATRTVPVHFNAQRTSFWDLAE